MIEDNDTFLNPWNIQDPWDFKLLNYHERYLFGNPETRMSVQECNKHKLSAKCAGGIIRFDNSQCFVLKTSYERQLETDRILLTIIYLK